jgi:hypothetical protein
MKRHIPGADHQKLATEIGNLAILSNNELKARWKAVYGTAAPVRMKHGLGFEEPQHAESLPTLTRNHRDEVALGNDADKTSSLQNRKATDLPLHQDPRGLNQRCIWSRGDYVATHHLFNEESVQYLSLGVLAVAKRARQDAAGEVALTNYPDQLLPVIVEHRQMTNSPEVHDVIGERELIVSF